VTDAGALLDLLVTHSYRHQPDAPILLASGQQSPYYVDCKATTRRGEAMELVGAAFFPHLPPGIDAVGGLTMGADPIADAIASYATRHGRPLNAFAVRKDAKGHGLGRCVEGPVGRGARVAVIDDVVTTGGSTLDAITKCRAEGLEVAAVLVLVDREQDDGLARVRALAAPAPVTALFTLAALRARAEARARAGDTRSATG
jgi:orotate phosphoribosyltransferase